MAPARQAPGDYRYLGPDGKGIDALPGGVGQVCRHQLTEEGRAAGATCDGRGPIVIKISWSSPGGTEQHVRVLQP